MRFRVPLCETPQRFYLSASPQAFTPPFQPFSPGTTPVPCLGQEVWITHPMGLGLAYPGARIVEAKGISEESS
jgi:hypothetical protein